MSALDIMVIVIMALCILIGAWRGFVRTVLGLVNFILAIFLTNLLYPYMSRFLQSFDGLYNTLTTSIRSGLGLDAMVYAESRAAQNEIINNLPLPAALRDAVLINIDNVTAGATATLAEGFANHVAGFLAVIVINVISMMVVFGLVFAGLMILTRVLNIVTKLPVINTANKLLGAALGAAWGLLLTWVVLGVVVVYLSANSQVNVVEMLENSVIAGPLNESNFVMRMLTRE